MSTTLDRLLVAAVVAISFSLAGLAARALTISGAVAAVFVGTAAYGFGGAPVAAAVIAFFLTGSILSRLGGNRAATARRAAAKGATRDAVQVLANGGAASVCAAIGAFSSAPHAWLVAAVGAVCAAAADTWATEIGALASSPPRSIVTWRVVSPGASGGVTVLGTLASAIGGAAMGAAASVFGAPGALFSWVVFGACAGACGSGLDSLLGATVQARFRCDPCETDCEARTHRCGARARLTGGLPFLDNDGVNAAATIAGALIGLAFWRAVS